MRAAGVELGHRHHGGFGGFVAARDQRLDRGDDLAGDRHRIARLVRHRGVAAAPFDDDLELVGGGEQRAGAADQHAVLVVGHDVQREGGVGERVEQPVLEHEARAVEAFLAGLEHEAHLAGELALPLGEQSAPRRRASRCGCRGRRRASAREWSRRSRARFPRASAARPCRRAAAPTDPGAAALEDRHRAGARGALAPFERQVGELGADFGQRQRGVEAELGLGMDRAAQRDDARAERLRLVEEVFCEHPAIVARLARTCHGPPRPPLTRPGRLTRGPSPIRYRTAAAVAPRRHCLAFRAKP